MIILLLILLLIPVTATSTTYFFSNSGSDSNNCESEETACATINKAKTLLSGSSDFRFECGSTFGDENFNIDVSGSSGDILTVDAYGTCNTTDDYPIFTAAELVTGWVSHDTNIWRTSSQNSSGLISGPNYWFDGLRAAWREEDASGCPGSMTEEYQICYSSDRNTVYVRTTLGDPDNLSNPGVERIDNTRQGGVLGVLGEWIHVSRVHMTKAPNCSTTTDSNLNVQFDDVECSHTAWQNNLYSNEESLGSQFGGWGMRLFGASVENSTGYFRIINSRINNIGRDGIDIDRGMPDGEIRFSNNVMHTFWNHGAINLNKDMDKAPDVNIAEGTVIVSNNDISSACGGISFSDGNDGGFNNLRITDNTIYGPVYNSDITNGTGAFVRWQLSGTGPDCGNKPGAIGSTGGEYDITAFISGNIVYGWERSLNFRALDAGNMDITIYNNTIAKSGESGIWLTHSFPVRVRNNLFYLNGGSSGHDIWCFTDTGCGGLDVRTNYFNPSDTNSAVFLYGRQTRTEYNLSNAISSFSQWRSSNIGNEQGSEPANLVVNGANDDYTPDSGSPLIDAGDTTSCDSFNGTACDIGAIESGETTSPPEPEVDGAVIPSTSPNLVRVTFATGSPPMLPENDCTGFNIDCSQSSPNISDCDRSPTNDKVMEIDLDIDIPAGDACNLDYDQASGNVTDSTSPTPIEVADTTDIPITNNVGGNLLSIDICSSPGTFAEGRELSNSFDGDTSTEEGSSGCNCAGEFVVTCDFGETRNVGDVEIFGDDDGTWWCGEYDLEHSLDGVDYTTAVTDANCFGEQWFTQDLGGTGVRFLRWVITGNNSVTPGRTQWRELGVSFVGSGFFPQPPTNLETIAPTIAIFPESPTGLDDTAESDPSFPGAPTSPSDSAADNPTFPGVPTNLGEQ